MDDRLSTTADGFSRRTALKAGAALGAAALIASGPIGRAHAVENARVIRVTDIDPTNATPAIQAAIDAASASGGGTVRLPAGVYHVASTLQLRTGVTLRGAGATSTVLRDASSLGAAPVIAAIGTAYSSMVRNVGIESLTVSNGAATTGRPTWDRDGVQLKFVDGFSLRGCLITEIQGFYGLRVRQSRNLTFERNRFYRNTASMLMLLPECDDVVVRSNEFDTLTWEAAGDLYMFATGAEDWNDGAYYVRRVLVENNRFVNNPRWEGIDTHGGENITIRNNYVENCHYGINCQAATGRDGNTYVTDPKLVNLVIENNTIVQGAATGTIAAINVDNEAGRPQALNVKIKNNRITGYGGLYTSYGSISVAGVTGAEIAGNTISNFGQYGICLGRVFGATVKNNRISDVGAIAPGGDAKTAAIAVRPDATAYGVTMSGNVLDAASDATAAEWFVYSPYANSSWQIDRTNRVRKVRQAQPYSNLAYLPVLKDSQPTTGLQQMAGDIIRDSRWKARWKVVSPATGYGALDTSTVLAAFDMTAGSKTATLANYWYNAGAALPPGMNITVQGAGPGGTDLVARVAVNNGLSTVELDTPCATAVIAASVRPQPLALSAV